MTAVSLTLSQAFDIALKFYGAGKLAEAEQVCLRMLSADADSAATLNLLAVIHASLGKTDAALSSYDRALSLQPYFIQALNNRGSVLKAMKRYDEALASYD
ncbi:MAG: tetratricopeptide repeat protein, partial [Bradyrhizobium sp.]